MSEIWRVCLTDIEEAYLKAQHWLAAGQWVHLHYDPEESHWVVQRIEEEER